MTLDEMVGWHHRLNGHGFGQTLAVGDGQGGLACCSSWDHKESDMTERLNGTEPYKVSLLAISQKYTQSHWLRFLHLQLRFKNLKDKLPLDTTWKRDRSWHHYFADFF